MFQAIGDWFSNLFGGGKKKKEEQPVAAPRPQQVQRQQVQQGGRWQATGRGQQPSAALQDRRHALAVSRSIGAPAPIAQSPADQLAQRQTQDTQADEQFRQNLTAKAMANRGNRTDQQIRESVDRAVQANRQARAAQRTAQASQRTAEAVGQVTAPLRAVREKVYKPVERALENYEKAIDSTDNEAGHQWTSPGDYLRFIAKLPSGMGRGIVGGGEKLGTAITGHKINDDNSTTKINGLQRAGYLVDGALDTAGVALGGSGKLLQAVTKQGVKQAAHQGKRQIVKTITKDAFKEGTEELIQHGAGDLADDGKINNDLRSYRDAFLLGGLGGTVMSGAGQGVSAFRNRGAAAALKQAVSQQADQDTSVASSANANMSPIGTRTAAEVQHNIDNGIITPDTKHLSPEQRAATAINARARVEEQQAQQVQEQSQPTTEAQVADKLRISDERAAEIQAYNNHIGQLRQQESKLLAQGLSENSAPIINNRKAQAEAIYARDHIGEMSPEGVRYRRLDETALAAGIRNPDGETLNDLTLRLQNEGVSPESIQIAKERFQRNARQFMSNPASMPEWSITDNTADSSTDYMMAHRPDETGPGAFNMEEGGILNSFYNNPADYGVRLSEVAHQESMDVLNAIRNNPDADVTIYRASPSGSLNDGDWVTLSKTYARQHQASNLNDNGTVHSFTVKAKDLRFAGDDINEFGYFPNQGDVDIKMRLVNQVVAEMNQVSQELLKSRHLELTGDEGLVFNEWRNAMEQSALGYYDPKTDKINLNQLTEDTLNHELGHKLLRRAENNAELIAHIRQTVGDDALVARYGKDYGTDDINLLAEEYLADGFSDYSKGILNGEDKVRLATRLNIPPRIIAAYDRIIEAVKSLIGKQDQIRQFYAQMETGKFRSAPQATTTLRRLEDSLAYRLDSQQAKDTVARFNSVKNGWRRKTVMSRVTPEVAEMYRRETGMPVGDNARLILSESTVRHMKNQGHIGGKGRYGVEDANPITDADIADIPVVFANPDSIQVKNEVGYKGRKIELTKQLDNRHVLAVELEQKPDGDFYIISYYNKSRSPRQAQASGSQGLDADFNEVPTSSRPKRPGEASDDSIANPPRIVNDKRFKVNDTAHLSEAGQDARDFYFEEYKDKGADAMRRDLIEQIWKENKKGKGVDFIQTPGEYYGGKRVSNNNPFYAGFYEEYGRKPTKKEITAIVDDALGIENELGRVSLPRAAEDYLIGNYFGDVDGLRAAYSQVGVQANTQVARPTANKLDNAARQEASEALQQEYETHLDHQWAARLDEKHKQEILKQRKAFDRQQQIKELIKHAYEQGPSRKLVDIADAVKSVTKAKKDEVDAIMQQVADDMNLDITGERAFVKNTSKVPSLVDPTTGEVTPIDQLISDEAVRKQMKPGVEHAVPADTERADLQGNARQMIYRNEDGTYGAYYEYRKADGTWHKPGAVPVTSALQTNLMSKITDDATINKEVKRAYEDGINIQYIWRESSDGANSELVKRFEEIVDKALTVVGKGKKKSPPGEVLSFDPNIHYIHKGKVVDGRTGQVMGNYVEITAKGDVIMYAGKKKIHLRQNDLDFDAFKQLWSSGATWTTEGQIDRMTGALDWPWLRNKDRSNSIEYFMEGKKNANKETLTEIMVELPRRMQAAMLQEGEALGSMVDEHAKKLRRTLPLRGRRQALQEAVYVIEPARPKRGEKAPTFEQRLESFRQVYGDRAAKQLAEYNAFLRATYKNLLMRVNEKRLELGMEPIHERADYLTHTSEIHSAGQTIFDNISSLAAGDIMDKGRGGLPAKLVGLTGSFKPNMKFNQFAQARYGDTKPADPFTPLKEYAKVALHNIHMTDAITMSRSLETAFRAASEARSEVAQMGPIGVETLANKVDDFVQNIRGNEIDIDEATTVLKKIYGLERGLRTKIHGFTEFKRAVNKARRANEGKETAVLADEDLAVLKNATERMVSSLVETSEDIVKFQELTKTADSLGKATYFVREHANRLAGKTDAMERAAKDEAGVLDRAGNMAIRGMQKQAALSKIVGNFSSVAAQAFSLPDLAATTSPTALAKALKSMYDPKVQQASAAVASRYAKDTLSRRSTFDKTMGIAGKPMEVFERTIIQYSFAAKYEHGISKGLSHDDAVRYAERFIGDTVTYRDAVSTPRAYKRKLPSLLLQFQREVVQQGRYKLRYITPKRAAVSLALYAVMTQAYEAMTGSKPGGDVVGALVATALDFAGAGDEEREEEEKTAGARIGRAVGRMTGEVVAMAPLVGSPINTFIDKETRKNIFGTENNLGRYAGGLAAVSQIQSAGNAISYWHKADKAAVEGDDDKAAALRERAVLAGMKEIPAGSQLRKSTQGYFAMSRGHTLDSHGEVKAEVDKNNPLKWVQAVAFGENALSEQQRANKTDNWFLRGGDSSVSSGAAPQGGSGINVLDAKDRLSLKKSIKKGSTVVEDGIFKTKSGEVKRDVHRRMAEKQGQSDEAYTNYLIGYGLDEKSDQQQQASTGDPTLDSLLNTARMGERSKRKAAITKAVAMFSDKKKFASLPDWVKDRFYKEHGFSKFDVAYSAYAGLDAESKIDGLYRPLAQQGDRKALLDRLWKDRRAGLDGRKMMADDKVISALQQEGFITKAEARTLRQAKHIKDADGKYQTKLKSSARGNGGGRMSRAVATGATARFMGNSQRSQYASAPRMALSALPLLNASGVSRRGRSIHATIASVKQSTKKRRLA